MAIERAGAQSPTRLVALLDSGSPGEQLAGRRLIERDTELGALTEAVARLREGQGAAILIEGPAGAGKSALVDHAATLALGAGLQVRRTAPGPHDREFTFGAVRALLEAPLRDARPDRRDELLDGPAAPARELLMCGETPGRNQVTAAAHAIMWLCASIGARRPLALIVDDAHWADRASLQTFAFLARQIEDLPVLLLLGARDGDPHAAADLLNLIADARGASTLRPAPLSSAGAMRLIRRHAPEAPAGVCRELREAAAGDPWLITELAAQARADGHPADPAAPAMTTRTRDTVNRRLAGLMPADRSVAATLAVIGEGQSPHAVAQVAGVPVADLGTARAALTAAGLLRQDRDAFVHPLIGAAIRDALVPSERDRLHRESARTLLELGGPAEHLIDNALRSRPQSNLDLSRLLRRAAERAASRGAPGAAAGLLERALGERAPGDDRGKLLASLATATFDAGLPGVRQRLQEALGEPADRDIRTDALTRLAALSAAEGEDGGVLDRVHAELEGERGLRARMILEAAALDALIAQPARHAERTWRASAVDLTTAPDPVLRRVGLAHRAWLETEQGSATADHCAQTAREALEGGHLLADVERRSAYHLCIRVLVLTDFVVEAGRAISALEEEAVQRGSVRLRAGAAWHAAELFLRTGDVNGAERSATLALELAERDVNVFAGGATRVLICALAERGAFDAAHDLLRSRGFDRELGDRPWEAGVLHARSRLALAEGDFERAHADAVQTGVARAAQGRPNPAWTGWRATAAMALAHLGRRQEAVALAEEELTLARSFGAPVPVAGALIARAVAEPDEAARAAACENALAVLEGRAGALETVRARLELGAALARTGRRVEARGALRPALAQADQIGAVLLARRAHRELVATGLRPRRPALHGVSALTPRQREICELAAAGNSNRVIAQQLFLSIKTVETHLAVCYRKLEIAGRRELSDALHA
jgi:DNA-binding CsgD family transcriptional regulator